MVVSEEVVSFPSGTGRCAGTLFRPADRTANGGVVVLAHGFGGVRAGGLERFAQRFAGEGFVSLTFDFRHFGESSGKPRQLVRIRRQLADWRAAVAFVRAQPDADATRVALWGFSLSGGHVHAVAAADPTVAAAIAQCPVLDGRAASYAAGRVHASRCALAAGRDVIRSALGLSPRRIGIVGEPGGPLAASEGDGLLDVVEGLAPPGVEWDNSTPARSVTGLPYYRPMREATRVRCPILYSIADGDTMASPEIVHRAATTAPNAESRVYRGDHFDLFYPPLLEEVVRDQLDFLSRHLLETGKPQSGPAIVPTDGSADRVSVPITRVDPTRQP